MCLRLGRAFFNHRDTKWDEQIQHCSFINREIYVVQFVEMISTYLHTRTQLITSEKYLYPSSRFLKVDLDYENIPQDPQFAVNRILSLCDQDGRKFGKLSQI